MRRSTTFSKAKPEAPPRHPGRALGALGRASPRPPGGGSDHGFDRAPFSAVSFAEIGVKVATGKLTVPDGLVESVTRAGVSLLPLEAEHGLGVAALPMHHRDPFDRLLISQARVERLAVLTSDQRFKDYDVEVIDATL